MVAVGARLVFVAVGSASVAVGGTFVGGAVVTVPVGDSAVAVACATAATVGAAVGGGTLAGAAHALTSNADVNARTSRSTEFFIIISWYEQKYLIYWQTISAFPPTPAYKLPSTAIVNQIPHITHLKILYPASVQISRGGFRRTTP
jgi:hypothetical protein